ncbi:MAG TPA: helix-turn-helix domain-containing protein [Polyangiaceae bacterium]|jgi:transcriptional regulator with XRE-family HTH domain
MAGALVRSSRSAVLPFHKALRSLRRELGWNQHVLAAHFGISVRTLTSWECGYALPPEKQRLHVLLSLREAPPQHVLNVAAALGMDEDPVLAPFLRPFEDALAARDNEGAPAVPPPPPRPTPEAVRAAVNEVVLEAANLLDLRPNEVRAIVAKVAAACRAIHANLEDLEGAVVPAAKAKGSERKRE